MNRQQFFEFVENFYKQAFELMQKKNNDYSQESNPFSNFEFQAMMAKVTVEQVFLMKLGDKMARMRECFDKPVSVLDESLEDTLKDTINFCALCAGDITKKEDVKKIKEIIQ